MKGARARWRTQLVLHEALPDVLITSEGDIAGHARLCQIEAASEVLLATLRTQHLLLLLLLCEVELVDATCTVL